MELIQQYLTKHKVNKSKFGSVRQGSKLGYLSDGTQELVIAFKNLEVQREHGEHRMLLYNPPPTINIHMKILLGNIDLAHLLNKGFSEALFLRTSFFEATVYVSSAGYYEVDAVNIHFVASSDFKIIQNDASN